MDKHMEKENEIGRAEGLGLINGRYRLQKSIGSGGMAHVYLAYDELLDREVAVKKLRDQFLSDRELQAQLLREAKSAARLINPYIIAIYDVLSDDNGQYIVMEYVDGMTLKEYMKQEQLTLHTVLEIGVRLADALEHAHKRNIIHCDIKPHNIILDKNLNPKIADFGIAKMVSSQTMVYSPSVMGSVHYIAPEQVSGSKLTASCDVYSLGVVLFEMLTGRVPFTGNNPVAVAMMHKEVPVPPLSNFMDQVPEGLQAIVDKALSKDPKDRYATAGQLRKELLALKMKLFPMSNADYTQELGHLPLTAMESETHSAIGAANNAAADNDDEKTMIMRRHLLEPELEQTQELPAGEAKEQEKAALSEQVPEKAGEDMARKKKKAKKGGLGLFSKIMLVLTALVVAVSAGVYFKYSSSGRDISVPNVREMTAVEAQRLLESQKFSVTMEERYDASQRIKPGYVMEQEPAGGAMRKEGSLVRLTISKGAELRIVPQLQEMTLEQARMELENMELKPGKITTQLNPSARSGIVLSHSPKAGDKAPRGSAIDLVINEGTIPVPKVMGKKLADAAAILRKAGLELGEVKIVEDSKVKDKGVVVATNPPAGIKMGIGDKVNLSLTEGGRRQAAYVEFEVPKELQKELDRRKKRDMEEEKRLDIEREKYKDNKDVELPPKRLRPDEYFIRVLITLTDDSGRRIVLSDNKKPGMEIRQKVEYMGEATVQFYCEGKLVEEKRL